MRVMESMAALKILKGKKDTDSSKKQQPQIEDESEEK